MSSQPKALTLLILFLVSCGDKDDFDVPSGNNQNNESDQQDHDCKTSWEQQNGLWIDPNLCAAWSSKSTLLNWEDALSYCLSLEEGSITNWQMPSFDDLQDMSLRNPPFEDLDGELWTTFEDTTSGTIKTINLSNAGSTWLIPKNNQAYVRCISK